MNDPGWPNRAQTVIDDGALFARVRGGDVAAFEALFGRYVDTLCTFAYAYTGSREDAEEVVHDLFLWAWTHRSAIEQPRSVAAYLHAAVRNRARNSARHEATELRIHGEAAAAGNRAVVPTPFDAPDARAVAADLRTALERAVAEMPLRCREVFTLSRGRHLSTAEIAAVLEISPKTVEIHMTRALAILRQRLAPWIG